MGSSQLVPHDSLREETRAIPGGLWIPCDAEHLRTCVRGWRRPPGFRARRTRLGYEVGGELIGCSFWEVPPGEAAYPYHYHYGDEELLIVVRGRPALRTPDGIRELDEGEVLRFPLGEDGAHQLLNRSEDTVTFLAISSHGRPDIVVYPDSNKLAVGERLSQGGGVRAFFHRELGVDYWDREQPPST